MASTGEADRSLLEGAPSSSYGAAGPRPQLTPDELLKELSRNADVYKDMIASYLLKGLAPLISEAIGSFVLVFMVGCCVTSPTPSPWAPVAIAAVLTVMVYATARISGADLNPAVSLALTLLGKKDIGQMLRYWLFQFLGAFAAAATYKMVCAPHLVMVAPVPPFHMAYALAAEAIFSCLLVFVAISLRPTPFFGLTLGFAYLGSAYACQHISGAALNPAVALALGIQGHGALWCLAELVGATAAAGLSRLLVPETGETGEAPAGARRLLAEAVGSFWLVATVGLNIVSASHATAYSAACVLMCLISCLGGHFNPALTLAVLLRGQLGKLEAAKYMLCQVLAGLLGSLVYVSFHLGSAISQKSIKLTPGHGYSLVQAGLAEAVASFVLAYALLAVQGEAQGLVVAFAFLAGGFAVGSVSGGLLNPAVVLALVLGNLVHPGRGGIGPATCWLSLLLAEVLAAALASAAFRFTHRSELKAKALKDLEGQP